MPAERLSMRKPAQAARSTAPHLGARPERSQGRGQRRHGAQCCRRPWGSGDLTCTRVSWGRCTRLRSTRERHPRRAIVTLVLENCCS